MNKDLLDILACPRCHGDLSLKTEDEQDMGLICSACLVMYPIREEIPIMLVDEALKLNDDLSLKDNEKK